MQYHDCLIVFFSTSDLSDDALQFLKNEYESKSLLDHNALQSTSPNIFKWFWRFQRFQSLQYFMNLLRVLACISWLFLLYIKLALFNILVVPSLQLSVNMFDLLYHNTRRETFVKLKVILEKNFNEIYFNRRLREIIHSE